MRATTLSLAAGLVGQLTLGTASKVRRQQAAGSSFQLYAYGDGIGGLVVSYSGGMYSTSHQTDPPSHRSSTKKDASL